jgi:hypothetical protein
VPDADLKHSLTRQVFPAMLAQAEGTDRPAVLRCFLLLIARLMAGARGLLPHGGGDLPSDLAGALDVALAALDTIDWRGVDVRLLGDLYTGLMADRQGRGSYYTPTPLAADVTHRTILPVLDECASPGDVTSLRILDPAMGSGHFLIAAGALIAGWLAERAQLSDADARRAALGCLYGIDRDPTAAELAAISLWLWAEHPGVRPADLRDRLVCGDALLDDDPLPGAPSEFDAVIGNPPFASAFTRARARDADARREALHSRYRTARGSFDLAVPFVERALGLCRPGGRCGLVLPNKLLSAYYARTLRGWVAERAIIEALVDWTQYRPFEAEVYPVTCVFRREPPQPGEPLCVYRAGDDVDTPAPIWRGTQADLHGTPGAVWSGVLDPAWGVLCGCLAGTIPLGEVATLSGGLVVREAYNLRPAIYDALPGPVPPDAFKLLTSGLIRRYHSLWGRTPARYLKRSYRRPAVPADVLSARRQRQASGPKIVVAGMGRDLRALVDHGTAQASVATTIIIEAAWPSGALCAVLNSRLVSRLYRALFGGLALNNGYLRFTRRELSLLPVPDLPADDPRLARLDALAARIAKADAPDASALDDEIEALVCALYGVDRSALAGDDQPV